MTLEDGLVEYVRLRHTESEILRTFRPTQRAVVDVGDRDITIRHVPPLLSDVVA